MTAEISLNERSSEDGGAGGAVVLLLASRGGATLMSTRQTKGFVSISQVSSMLLQSSAALR